MRRLFKTRYRAKYPHPDDRKLTDQEKFFIDLIDNTRFHVSHGLSRFQLHYGLRRDDNFGERMASRVIQWRSRLEYPEKILSDLPELGDDIVPMGMQNESEFYCLYAILNLKTS